MVLWPLRVNYTCQNKMLGITTNASGFVTNHTLHKDLKIKSVYGLIEERSASYQERKIDHTNHTFPLRSFCIDYKGHGHRSSIVASESLKTLFFCDFLFSSYFSIYRILIILNIEANIIKKIF